MGALALLGLTGFMGVSAALAARDLQEARSGLLAVADASELDLDTADESVARARRAVDRAVERLSSPPVRAVAAVPIIGRSFAAERAVALAAQSALVPVELLLEVAPDLAVDGGVDVQRMAELAERLKPLAERAQADLRALQRTPTWLTPSLVRDAVEDTDEALSPVVAGLDEGTTALPLVAGLLGADGPRPVLVALQNNAELRGTGGYVSTFAVGRVADGRLELEPFRDINDVNDPVGQTRPVPAPPEYVEDFGVFLADTTLWREWTMSPDVPDAAAVSAEAARVLLGEAPEVVLLLDVPALARIVGVADRAVRLPDGTLVGARDLTEALLVDSYAAVGPVRADQAERRAELRAAAGQTVTEILTGEVATLSLARELGRLAGGRHLAVWSARPSEQQQLEELGLAGSADPRGDDSLLVSVNNLNENKLDFYIDRSVTVGATVSESRVDVVQSVVLVNRAPEGLVSYVAGREVPGTAVERVELSISAEASFASLRLDGALTTGDVRAGQERTRVHTYVTVPRGGRVEIELRYSVPITDGRYRLRLIPQPLAEDASLSVTLRPAEGQRLRSELPLIDGEVRRSGPFVEQELLEVSVHPADSQ